MVFVILFGLLYLPVSILFPTKVIYKNRMPKNKKCIATSNHYSNLDPLIYNFRFVKKFRFLAKKELFSNKFTAWLFKKIGAIKVDRNQITPSVYKECLKELKNDKQLFIFPEGTRNKQDTEEMGDIKSGVITFASKGDAEIIPMLMYRRPKLFRKNYIIVGESFKIEGVDTKRLTKEELEANTERYTKVMDKLRIELDQIVNKKKKDKVKNN